MHELGWDKGICSYNKQWNKHSCLVTYPAIQRGPQRTGLSICPSVCLSACVSSVYEPRHVREGQARGSYYLCSDVTAAIESGREWQKGALNVELWYKRKGGSFLFKACIVGGWPLNFDVHASHLSSTFLFYSYEGHFSSMLNKRICWQYDRPTKWNCIRIVINNLFRMCSAYRQFDDGWGQLYIDQCL